MHAYRARALLLALAVLVCTDAQPVFRRIENGLCAEQALPERITVCPRWVVLYFGKLVPGTCASAGFVHYHGDMTVLAGPCGYLSFRVHHAQPPPVPRHGVVHRSPRQEMWSHTGAGGVVLRKPGWWWQKKTNCMP